MKIKIFKLLILSLIFSNYCIAQNNFDMSTVDSVDINKYIGTWYEIAKIPNSFQDQCVKNTTATYSINSDGDLEVLNQCINNDGEIDEAEGIARIADKQTNSKLEVSFVSIFGWHLFWGDYWILGLDKNYKYAAIGTPSRKYAWILSRTPELNEADLETCFKIFEQNGYSRKSFEFDVQEN